MSEPSPDSAKRFQAILRKAAKPLRPEWKPGSNSVAHHPDTDYWAHVWFYHRKGGSAYADGGVPFLAQPSAGVVSPYLLRTFNGQRTDRAPMLAFRGVHADLQWGVGELEFDVGFCGPTQAYGQGPRVQTVRLGESSMLDWLEQALTSLCPRLEQLCSDEALLEHLSRPGGRSGELRYASLLAYHMRRDAEMNLLLDRAEVAVTAEDEEWTAAGQPPSRYRDRQKRFPQNWSHARFVRFLLAAPRD